MAKTTWTPNEKQTMFMGALADGKVKSLRQINHELGVNLEGLEVINHLLNQIERLQKQIK